MTEWGSTSPAASGGRRIAARRTEARGVRQPLARPAPLRQAVYDVIAEMIVNRELQPGEHLVENELAAQLGVSRQPVREALQRLHSEGWVDLRPALGAFVHVPTEAEADELLATRTLLETESARLAAKRATQAEQDKEERKKNEQIRMKSTKETQEAKEDLQKKEQIKEAQAKRAEKLADQEAKKRVLAKLEADKQERKRKAEIERAQRAGKAPPPVQQETGPTSSGPTTSKPASAYTEARLALQTPAGRVTKTFPVETTLFEVAHALEQDGTVVNTFTTNFPKKVFDKSDFGLSLKEAGMVPSAALIVG